MAHKIVKRALLLTEERYDDHYQVGGVFASSPLTRPCLSLSYADKNLSLAVHVISGIFLHSGVIRLLSLTSHCVMYI